MRYVHIVMIRNGKLWLKLQTCSFDSKDDRVIQQTHFAGERIVHLSPHLVVSDLSDVVFGPVV